MAGRYEVLLRRENGASKTVIIEDCVSSNEALHTAQSMYGMPALRATWLGDDSSYSTTSSTSSSSRSSGSSMSDSDALGGLLGFGALAVIGGVIMFVVQYWWIFLIIAIVLGGLLWLGRDEL